MSLKRTTHGGNLRRGDIRPYPDAKDGYPPNHNPDHTTGTTHTQTHQTTPYHQRNPIPPNPPCQ